MVELVRDGSQAGFDIAQALPTGELGEGHGEELISAAELPNSAVPVVPADASVQYEARAKGHELRKDHLPFVHHPSLKRGSGKDGIEGPRVQIGAASQAP
jgi:hypothetical protein